ncbi:hypothetical protein [Antrihabitans stalactiti]|uniref:CHAP domain-containing protein n=1 Tax=Antrihabitans stalactiti TaxID=2584121 RepID=A0A848KFW2_9NOCA|nr:hypothetical protein [Antrihabitans stalactiti]NMN95100.1 hypothetical protein [Antrihabitans stalactiti]
MTDASLQSRQEGWYNVGDQLTLSCSKHGQKVKGYFSFNIPGGWDDLWYQTSDGHFVADVDIETGTLSNVAPACGSGAQSSPAAAPQSAPSSKVDAALAKANAHVGTDDFGPRGCMLLVADAFSVRATGYNTPNEFRAALAAKNQFHADTAFPKGVLVFSESSWDGGGGHIDIARGDGTFVSGGVDKSVKGTVGAGHYVQVLSNPNPGRGSKIYGWAYAPW